MKWRSSGSKGCTACGSPGGPQAGLLSVLVLQGMPLQLKVQRGRLKAGRPPGLVGLVGLLPPASEAAAVATGGECHVAMNSATTLLSFTCPQCYG